MESQINLGTLLQAAKLLDIGALTKSNLESTTQSVFELQMSNDAELRALFAGKMKQEKKTIGGITRSANHPYCSSPNSRKSSKHSRAAHNELEKTRRANLRGCLEQLKSLVPSLTDVARNTTLALLTRARDHILELAETREALLKERKQKEEENAALLAELAQLQADEEVAQATSNSSNSSVVSRPESQASFSSMSTVASTSRDSPYFFEYSPSNKPSNSSSPKHLIDPIADGLISALPITYPRPQFYPKQVLEFFHTTYPSFDVSHYLPINLRV